MSLLMFILIMRLFCVSTDPKLNDNKNFYKLKIFGQRGMIYDCNNIPLVENENKIFASVVPDKNDFIKIINNIKEENRVSFVKNFKKGFPFICELDKNIKCDNLQIFKIPMRSKKYNLACHVIGYVSDDNFGVSGIEKAFDEHLKTEDIEIWYQQNAIGNIISEKKYNFNNKTYQNISGVRLCIDKKIQSIVEEVSKKYISKGAVLVSEVPNCEIRASLSLPSYSPENVQNLLESEDSDLINRINYPYNLGSIFKLVTSIAFLENGINEDMYYNCSGSLKVEDDKCIKCFSSTAHGEVNIEEAVSKSCNTFFAYFSNRIDGDYMLKLSRRLGFGKSVELAPGICSHSGNLPSYEDLKDAKKMSMLSFGQGCLMVTPIQVLGFINSIASGGLYSIPKLVDCLINKDGSISSIYQSGLSRVLRSKTAEKIKKYMKTSITKGTSRYGKPENVEAAAKTSTAETGIIKNGKRVNQSWFAGFFPFENPKYCVVILSENENSGGKICGPIFKEIADKISNDCI